MMFIDDESTAYGRQCQPHTVEKFDYRIWMNKKSTQKTLWENVLSLMTMRYGRENITRFAQDTKVGQGTPGRIKAGETSTRIETLDLIAKAFSIETWQLLVPGFDPKAPPRLSTGDDWPFPGIDRSRFDRLDHDQKIEVQGAVRSVIVDIEGREQNDRLSA